MCSVPKAVLTFRCVWVTLFIESWKKQEAHYKMRWGTEGCEEGEPDRPDFESIYEYAILLNPTQSHASADYSYSVPLWAPSVPLLAPSVPLVRKGAPANPAWGAVMSAQSHRATHPGRGGFWLAASDFGGYCGV